MTWVYKCEMDKYLLTANTKDALTDKLRKHLIDEHHISISRDEVEQMVDRRAQQAA